MELLQPWIRKVSAPHPISNIRRITEPIPADEVPAEKSFRVRKNEVYLWHHNLWLEQNQEFEASKRLFIEKYRAEHNLPVDEAVPSAAMSPLYAQFLERSRALHGTYAREWFAASFALIPMWLNAKRQRFFASFRTANAGKGC